MQPSTTERNCRICTGNRMASSAINNKFDEW